MGRLLTLEAMQEERERLRGAGLRLAFTNGCFDVLHGGHVLLLAAARAEGDALCVGLNTDASVARIKGPARPILPEGERAELLTALAPVDYVVLFGEDTPLALIEALVPDVLVKGADWAEGTIVGAEIVEGAGGRVVRAPLAPGLSTSGIVRGASGAGPKG